MKRIFTFALILPAPALAEGFQRPIPQPQTDSAELWYFVASLALLGALVAVQMLVSRR